MNPPSWQLERIIQERQKDFAREAEEYRLVRLALQASGSLSPLQSLIHWFSQRLQPAPSSTVRRSASYKDPMENCATC